MQRFQPGQEGRYANSAGHPDLTAAGVVAVELEAAVRPFDLDLLAGANSLRKILRVVSQRLDVEGDYPAAPVGAITLATTPTASTTANSAPTGCDQ